MIAPRRRRECAIPVLSAIISFFVGVQYAFIILSASGTVLPSPPDEPPPLDELNSSNVTTRSSSSRSPSPLDDGAFFSSLFERGKEFKILPVQTQPKESDIKDSICVVVRTYAGHGRKLQVFLSTWANIATNGDNERNVQIVLANTDGRAGDAENMAFFYDALSPALSDAPQSRISYHMAVLPEGMVPKKNMFGYDVTQLVLDELLNSTSINCSTFLFTNGDNYYNPDLLVQTKMNVHRDAARPGLVGFDFVSHHVNPLRRDRDPNHHVSIKFKHLYVDLGAVFVDADAVRRCKGAEFRDRGAQLNFMADWLFFQALVDCAVKTELVHQTLFMHH